MTVRDDGYAMPVASANNRGQIWPVSEALTLAREASTSLADGSSTHGHRSLSRSARYAADRRVAKEARRAANRAAFREARWSEVQDDDRLSASFAWDLVRADLARASRQVDVDLLAAAWRLVREAMDELRHDLALLLGWVTPDNEGEEQS